jgi:hypothetical protein
LDGQMSKTNEELSAALDQLNCGKIAETNDQEVKDLLEVAVLLRSAGLPVQPPEHLLAASVERAAAGLTAHKTSRRNPWLYSGLLGAAAALLVFVGIHGFPSIQEAVRQTTPPPQSAPASPPVSTIKEAPVVENPLQPPTAVPSPSSPTPSPRLAAAPDKQVTANSPGVTPSPPPAANRQPVPSPPEARAESAALPPSTRTAPAAIPWLKSTLPPSPPAEKSTPTPLTSLPAFQLPGRTPDSITKDVASGSVRQVFNAGTPQELVITQRRLPQMEKDAALQSKSQAAPEAARKYSTGSNNLNKVVVTINGQEVTLEGRQTVDELTELAKLLQP